MKAIVFILSLMFLTSLASCDSHEGLNDDENLIGSWNLIHISGGVDGRNLTFVPGLIIWTFNEDTHMVTIINSSENGLSVLQSGTYSYAIEGAGNDKTIIVDGLNLGNIEISQNQISIDQRVADGILLELTKVDFIHF